MAVYHSPGLLYLGPRAWSSIYEDSMAREAWVWRTVNGQPAPKTKRRLSLLEQIDEDRKERWEDELDERVKADPPDDGWDDWF